MGKESAGILPYRKSRGQIEVFLVHPGGPFWARKDRGAWSIPKGEFEGGEDPLEAAKREFAEETGMEVVGPVMPLGSVRQKGGKVVHAWAVEADLDPSRLQSNTFTMEWPPHSGRMREFPEVDRAGWFDIPEAQDKVHAGQVELIRRLVAELNKGTRDPIDPPRSMDPS